MYLLPFLKLIHNKSRWKISYFSTLGLWFNVFFFIIFHNTDDNNNKLWKFQLGPPIRLPSYFVQNDGLDK